jgi:sugar lactone lactonase YvrE
MLFNAGKYNYELVKDWAKVPPGWSFLDVCGLSIDTQDRVYVLSRSDRPVSVFDRDGNLLTSWGQGFFKHAHGSCGSPSGNVFCTDDMRHVVAEFTPEGKLQRVLGNLDQPSDTGYSVKPGGTPASIDTIKRGGPPFNRPTGVTVAPWGEIYVSDGYGNCRVHRFAADGILLQSWGEPGEGQGQFRLPHCVRIDSQDRVWVSDRENGRFQIFDRYGNFLEQWTGFSRPTDLFFDKEGTIYISELNQRVSLMNMKGDFLGRWGTPGEDKKTAFFVSPHTIAVDSHGDIYVGEVSMTTSQINQGAMTVKKLARKSKV